ncbi:hypothetical protein O1L60_13125 [Streptomyces diastatochromogenes]|nr:hypothetical protein [Streptomyces diastatochromogenes]
MAVESDGDVFAGDREVVREPGRAAQEAAVGEFHAAGAGVAGGDAGERFVEEGAPEPGEDGGPRRGVPGGRREEPGATSASWAAKAASGARAASRTPVS